MKYRVLEAHPDEKNHKPIGKTIDVKHNNEVVLAIFELYRFTEYASYYRVVGQVGDEKLEAQYNYPTGFKPDWILVLDKE